MEESVRSPAASDANATDRETVRDIVNSFFSGEPFGTGGLYVRESTATGAIATLIDPGTPDCRDDGACRAEARGRRSEQRRPHDVGRSGPAGYLELRDHDAARALARPRGESGLHAGRGSRVRAADTRASGDDEQHRRSGLVGRRDASLDEPPDVTY